MIRTVARLARTARSARAAALMPRRFASRWAHVEMGPKDPILGVSEAFAADTDKRKLNLGVGAYRDDNNKPVVIDAVKEAQKRITAANLNNEYAPIAGDAAFVKSAVALAYGAAGDVVKNSQVAAVQSLSGTGALRLAGAYVQRFTYPGSPAYTVHIPDPTWGNHFSIFGDAGLKTKTYRYYEPSTRGLNLNGMLADINAAPNGSFFLFHACAHNPTGVDPKPEQWKEISALCKKKNHLVMMDMAYQGFASGNPDADAFALRQFVSDGHQVLLAQSFAKNFGLYGQRIGTFSVVTGSKEETARVESQVKILARAMYSNPPVSGSRVVQTILSDAGLTAQWKTDVKMMADRIITMRKLLKERLYAIGSTHKWEHVTDQIGMFCYSGLTGEQVDRLTSEFHIYLTRNGRISMAGVTTKDIPYLADAIHAVTKGK